MVYLVLGASCRDPEPEPPNDYERREGDGCGDAPSECATAELLWECRDRTWTLVNCDEACADEGGAAGCLAEDAGGARCWCESFAPECVPGSAECVSAEELDVCQADTLAYARFRCDDLCASLTPPMLSAGCWQSVGGECRCTLEGMACPVDSSPHCEQDDLARCVDGVWTLTPCLDLCGDLHCDPFADGGARCDCDVP